MTIIRPFSIRSRALTAVAAVSLVVLAGCSAGSEDDPDTDAASPSPDASVAEVADDADVLAAVLDDWAQTYPAAADSPAAVGILRDGLDPVVSTAGVSAGADVVDSDWYRFGSVTKTYVAVALLRLVERGELDLDVPVGTYIDGVPGGDTVTARQLLSHTSGLPDYITSPGWAAAVRADLAREWTAEEALALVPDEDPQPAGYSYSSTNYVILGLLLEELTGLSVRDAVDTEVLDPAGLTDTDMSSEGHPVVGGLTDPGDGAFVSTLDGPYTAVETSAGAAGSISGTVADLLRFGQALLTGDLLSEESWAQMTDFGTEGIYGLGIADLDVVSDGEVQGLGNYGEIPGFGALLVLEPDTGSVLVAVSGDDRASGFELGAALQQALAGDPTDDGDAGAEDAGDDAAGDEDAAAATAALFEGIDPQGPGCSVAVSRSGEIVYAEAWGLADLDAGTPMTTDTVVDIGSTSKQFTATAALLLVERGDLDLDAPVSAYLDGLPGWADEVSVRELMHHTSGIPDYIDGLLAGGTTIEEAASTEDALAYLRGVEQTPTVGDFAYSNSNYLLLGEVVGAVTGTDLATFVEDEIFAPAGMSAVMDPVADIPAKAVSYGDQFGQWVIIDSGWSQVGDGGIQTTPSEVAQWGRQYWEPTVGPDSITQERQAGAVATGQPDEGRYGAGAVYKDVDGIGRVIFHPGGWEGFVTTFAVLPDDEIAVAATCVSPDLSPVRQDIDTDLLRIWAAGN